MGLKRTNYEVKSMNITLPNAYAYVRDMTLHGDEGVATIVVQTSRENAIHKEPFEERIVRFDVNREENPYIAAYKAAKEQVKAEWNKELKKIEEKIVPGPFAGWYDDIQ